MGAGVGGVGMALQEGVGNGRALASGTGKGWA